MGLAWRPAGVSLLGTCGRLPRGEETQAGADTVRPLWTDWTVLFQEDWGREPRFPLWVCQVLPEGY
jgi:hypothetical protein